MRHSVQWMPGSRRYNVLPANVSEGSIFSVHCFGGSQHSYHDAVVTDFAPYKRFGWLDTARLSVFEFEKTGENQTKVTLTQTLQKWKPQTKTIGEWISSKLSPYQQRTDISDVTQDWVKRFINYCGRIDPVEGYANGYSDIPNIPTSPYHELTRLQSNDDKITSAHADYLKCREEYAEETQQQFASSFTHRDYLLSMKRLKDSVTQSGLA